MFNWLLASKFLAVWVFILLVCNLVEVSKIPRKLINLGRCTTLVVHHFQNIFPLYQPSSPHHLVPLQHTSGRPLACEDPQFSCSNSRSTSAASTLTSNAARKGKGKGKSKGKGHQRELDTCCNNSPGGLLLQTQFWDADPPTGPIDSWTVHGLWPDHCDGTFDEYCDDSRTYSNISAIITSFGREDDLLSGMETLWKDYQGDDEDLWEHEWNKHGTCISTLERKCFSDYEPQQEVVAYFDRTMELFRGLDSFKFLNDAGIHPSMETTYSLDDVKAALHAGHGVDAVVRCRDGSLSEIWYAFYVAGNLQTGEFEPAEPDTISSATNCPLHGIRYSPKLFHDPNPAPTKTTTTTTTTTTTGTKTHIPNPTSTADPFSGQGFLDIFIVMDTNTNLNLNANSHDKEEQRHLHGKEKEGCIISPGTWYRSGTCARFTAAATAETKEEKRLDNGNDSSNNNNKNNDYDDDNPRLFTLTSSRGLCSFASEFAADAATKKTEDEKRNRLVCSEDVENGAIFSNDGSNLSFNGSTVFFADKIPTGWKQEDIYSDSGVELEQNQSLEIRWRPYLG